MTFSPVMKFDTIMNCRFFLRFAMLVERHTALELRDDVEFPGILLSTTAGRVSAET
jgi:hypothetical protein